MTGVLDGVRVLDLSSGIAGPIATMLLADHGAEVTKIEPPAGDPFRSLSGYRVWGRGKRSAVLDLKNVDDARTFRALVSTADVLVESFSPGTTQRLGVSYEDLRTINPRLVYCSITGYGTSGELADRPAYDGLVAARTGQLFEQRGVTGGTISHISGGDGMLPGLEPEDQDSWVGPARKGPLFSGVAWPSMATAYNTTLAISAALRARELSGRGQFVHTSLLQGVLANTIGPWQRIEKHDAPALQSWVIDPRAPKGFFRGADGRWTHHWVPLPGFILGTAAAVASKEEGVAATDWKVSAPKDAIMRIGVDAEDMVILQHYNSQLTEAVASLSSEEWVRIAAQVGVPVQPVRSPEEALLDPAFLADGCVVEVDDPEVGPIRQVGDVYRLSACPTVPRRPAPALGQHSAEVRAEAQRAGTVAASAPSAPGATSSPLSGIRVIDLGLAVAGPFGTQLLSDLGADVIKVNNPRDGYWFATHIAMSCNRGKRSIALNLKDPAAMEVLHRLVATADVVQHNMRYDAAVRLGVDYESLRKIKPDLIYCHTRGFERGEREGLPGNDQTGAALAGTEWLDGGVDHGGRPIWSLNSAGDTGNGYLSAIGMVQALYHRDRTGEGQFIDTSIVYAQLLNASMSWSTPDGAVTGERPSVDAMQYGWSALYGLYRTAEGWLCIAVLTEADWSLLCETVGRPDLTTDDRFASPGSRRDNDADLRTELETVFAQRSAVDWFKILDAAGIACEVSSTDFVHELFDSKEWQEKGWVTSYEHGAVGKMDVFGLLFDFDETPGRIAGPPPLVGEHTHELLAEAGYTADQVAELLEQKAAYDTTGALRP
jgi:crotonobetainyl-CoA:carnitine CoA-transferase CaiB-like acyl-CoA transferase